MMVLPMKIPVKGKELTCMARSYVYQDDNEGVLSSLMNGNYDLPRLWVYGSVTNGTYRFIEEVLSRMPVFMGVDLCFARYYMVLGRLGAMVLSWTFCGMGVDLCVTQSCMALR